MHIYIATLKSGEMQVIEKNKKLKYESYSIEKINIRLFNQCANSAYKKIKENKIINKITV